MKFNATYTVSAARERVFTMMSDPVVLQRCIDGCEKMVLTGDDSYDAHLKIGVAGLKGNYIGKVQLKDKLVPEYYTLLVEGKGKPGFVKARLKSSWLTKTAKLSCAARQMPRSAA